ncbi:MULTISPECIES: hypothetical protein [Spirosoma]|uniref:Uncharacterized protein n=1 Tax=Spirosoma sordidisoli TaxID=2502893 RepID=A0A4Q2UF22_9BACT|nr:MULTISPECIES: hypothetical protein [Spirosoma]RYC67873.1 hypothetical protein EQG79_20625 [Spirosoma sordidisoli]
MTGKITLLCLLLTSLSLTGYAQTLTAGSYTEKNRLAGYAAPAEPSGIFWMTETNRKPSPYTIVRFYDETNQLIYEEKLPGRCLNIYRKRVVRQLNRARVDIGRQWALKQQIRPDDFLVASYLRR